MRAGLAIGVASGLLAGIFLDQVGLGLAVGVALGAAAGGVMRISEKKAGK